MSSNSSANTVLVTGATGFVGANVARVLLERGNRVRVLARPTSNLRNIEGLNVEVCIGDLRDRGSVDAAVKGCEEVYHVAAEYSFWSVNPDSIYNSNITGTANVMEAALKYGVRKVIYTSTVGAIGLGDLPEACDENSALAPAQLTGHYKRSKYEAERTALGYVRRGLPLVVVNPSAPVGPWDGKPTPTGRIILDFVQGRMPAFLNTGLNIVHVRDVAIGHVLAAEKGRVGERYILGNQNMSLEGILSMLAKLTGKPKPKMRIPYTVAWLAALASTKTSDWITHREPAIALEAVKMAKNYMYFSAEKAVRELGLPQTPVEQAFQDAIDWYSKYGYFNSVRFSIPGIGEAQRVGTGFHAS